MFFILLVVYFIENKEPKRLLEWKFLLKMLKYTREAKHIKGFYKSSNLIGNLNYGVIIFENIRHSRISAENTGFVIIS
jgi:hypothetical protein